MKIHVIFDVTMAPSGDLVVRDSTNMGILVSPDTLTIEEDFTEFLEMACGLDGKVEIYEDA